MVTRVIDLDGICDHCACGSPAAIIQDAGRFRVQCTGCGDDTDYYGSKTWAVIAWNKKTRKGGGSCP